jgi:hypothetical protein
MSRESGENAQSSNPVPRFLNPDSRQPSAVRQNKLRAGNWIERVNSDQNSGRKSRFPRVPRTSDRVLSRNSHFVQNSRATSRRQENDLRVEHRGPRGTKLKNPRAPRAF